MSAGLGAMAPNFISIISTVLHNLSTSALMLGWRLTLRSTCICMDLPAITGSRAGWRQYAVVGWRRCRPQRAPRTPQEYGSFHGKCKLFALAHPSCTCTGSLPTCCHWGDPWWRRLASLASWFSPHPPCFLLLLHMCRKCFVDFPWSQGQLLCQPPKTTKMVVGLLMKMVVGLLPLCNLQPHQRVDQLMTGCVPRQ